jgi:hypothetical protein
MKTTILRAAFVVAAPLALLGCRAGYEVDVRNMTDQPLNLRLNTPHTDGAPHARSVGRVGPGDRTRLFTQTYAKERVWLEADFEGNLGYPATLDLSPGLTAVNVRRIDEGSKGRIRMEEIPRP